MAVRDPSEWMWDDALAMLARADQLHRQLFRPGPARSQRPRWEPPVDVLETAGEVFIIAALPGVRAADVDLAIDGAALLISGERVWPAELRGAAIHRLELPQGRFERRVPLPKGRYDQIRRHAVDGCLVVTLRKNG